MRVLLALPGLAALAWGAVLLAEVLLPVRPLTFELAAWLIAGPVVHDLLIAPVVGAAGLGLASVTGRVWRGPVVAGTVVSGVLVLLAVPLLWREFGTPPSPGLHDGDTWAGLGWSLLAVWVAVLVSGMARTAWNRRSGP
ncbi:hypothetical protein [Amycolatopsis suaedae]|uniref:Uncharacterized protein n=1 Tax=Amycolatopsis suaedae TaxID=2510978 RepID=A0A4V2EM06_9PSEU|nr:hypothetical protein [Amycolatopsis suaedae]RZQ63395.1 hypothetical protein EWH70_13175 [Amycolatopsis suaedae]